MAAEYLIAAALIVAVGALIQGSVGFGLGLIAAPLLILLDTRLVPGPLLIAAVVLTASLAWREWHSVIFADLKWALAGRLIGTTAGAAALVVVSRERIALVFGVLILLSVGISALGFEVRKTARVLLGAGTVSGFTGTTVSIGGPPVALVYQHSSGPAIRGTLSSYFTVGAAMSLAGLFVIGRLGVDELIWGAAMVPGVLLGSYLSRWTAGVLDRGYTRTAVLVFSAAAAVVVMIRA